MRSYIAYIGDEIDYFVAENLREAMKLAQFQKRRRNIKGKTIVKFKFKTKI